QENLSRALGMVGRVVSSRSSLPVLSNVLLSTDAKRLKISATNLEIGINCWVGCKVEEDGAITVPARLFGEFVSSLPAGNIELATNDLTLKVQTPHYESNINGISADEFPLIPEIKNKPALTLPVEIFRDALAQVVVAASLDEARPVLSGVYLYTDEDQLIMVATDSYRLAERKLKLVSKPAAKLSIIVPARTMQELSRILAETDGNLSMYLSENQIMFETDNIELTSRLIEGQFPNYHQIIPEETETGVEIDTAEFSRITKVANLFARENAGGIKIEIKAGGQIDIISAASQIGENTSSAECVTTGGDGDISLNARYLAEALNVIKSPKVSFDISGKLNPCIMRPMSKDDEHEQDYLHIIMPLRT
ncbi:MAG TPA: DNA polymerase III subunit beta, partial [Candidatus Nanoarchaeia archaeon]|nr:DNA polymerase III subunit beta [Candidatus Nanoarchaeia archaeon]